MDVSSFAWGMAAMAPAQVLLILGFRHRGRRLARTNRQLRVSTATVRRLADRNAELAKELASRPAPARPPHPAHQLRGRPVLSPASATKPVDDPASTVVFPAQWDATMVLSRTDPAATMEIPVGGWDPADTVVLPRPAGMAEYPRRSRLAGGRGPS